MSKYVIVNAETIQKRIEELEKQIPEYKGEHYCNVLVQERNTLKQILSQSTPLIPVLENAFESGVDSLQDNLIQKLGLRYQTSEVSSTTINGTRGSLDDYISNFKLDI